MMICDNAARCGDGRPIVGPQCYDSDASRIATVTYREGGGESDTLFLCGPCTAALRKDARRQGYGFSSKGLEG